MIGFFSREEESRACWMQATLPGYCLSTIVSAPFLSGHFTIRELKPVPSWGTLL